MTDPGSSAQRDPPVECVDLANPRHRLRLAALLQRRAAFASMNPVTAATTIR